ncbi:MAG: putative bifunctional diguanylate cyclase/phosphodiesterase [Acidimicrobiales bacterium]
MTTTTTTDQPSAPQRPTAFVALDSHGSILYMSASGEPLTGKAPNDLLGVNIAELLKERQGLNLVHAIQGATESGRAGGLGRHWLSSSSRPDVLVEVFFDPAAREDGQVLLCLRDVTAEFIEEQKLRNLSDPFQHGLDGVDMAVTRWTPSLDLEYHSPEFEPLVMGTKDLLLTNPFLDDVGLTESACRMWRESLTRVVDAGDTVEFDWETDDFRHIHSRAVAESDADGFVSCVLVVSHDVTEERSRYEELTRRALHDPLTGLANRATALSYIDRVLDRRGRTAISEAVIFIDLDQFKSINDSLGHALGDDLLVTVAKRLSTVLRPADVVSRLGGDEFIVFLEQMTSIEEVLHVVDRLRAAISEPLTLADRELCMTASMGLAFAGERHETAENMVANADAAMYKAKEAGRDRVELYDDALRVRAEQRMKNEHALRRAMKNGEMEVHFLPEFDLELETVVGAEALLRWQHPERGLIPAAEFIGLAEESGLLVRLGTEVLSRSCELVAGWMRNRALADFTLRVNISPKQLAQPTLAPAVQEILEATKLEPSVLCLELAEATLTEHMGESVKRLERLGELGVKISVDNFGTAASSLALLKQLPVDMLRIDRSFVVGLGVDPRDSALVEAILQVGEALGLDVVAEGIDNDYQLRELLALGCVRGQGYLLSHVLRPNEFLRRWI